MLKKSFMVLVLLTLFTLYTTNAYAYYDKTVEDAVTWVLGHEEGRQYDYDGLYPGECVDLIVGYIRYISGYTVSYNAKEYATFWLPEGFPRYEKGTPQKGSIIVWTGGSTGHVGIVTNVEASGKVIYSEQNRNGSHVIKHNSEMWPKTNDYWGVILPDFKPFKGTLDVNSRVDGRDAGTMEGYGTFDIRVGNTTLTNQSDYWDNQVPAGTTYTISNIKAAKGKIYNGLASGSLTGTIQSGGTIDVRLKFDTCNNHFYDSGTVTKSPTCSTIGVRTFTCAKCGQTRTETIEKLAHTPVIDFAVPATVTSTGLTEGSHCAVCNTVLTAQQETPRLPRVLYDFDMDGDADPVMSLPAALRTVEEEAFEGGDARVIVIPNGVTTIGSRAFANMPNLTAVFWPETVRTISFDIFEGSPNVVLYVQKGSRWGIRLDLPYVEIDTGWVEESAVPAGAVITAEQWTYDYVIEGTTTTKTSTTKITEDGWVLTKEEWNPTSTGSQKYVNGYPSGYNGYKGYTTSKWTAYENATSKRTVNDSLYTYVYWHWCFNPGYLSGGSYNVYISDIPYETDSGGRYFQYFTSFESSVNAGHSDPYGAWVANDVYYFWRDTPTDGSWWWFRFPVYQQTRTDYQKLYTYTKTTPPVNESRTSDTEVTESDTIRNVRRLVKYSY